MEELVYSFNEENFMEIDEFLDRLEELNEEDEDIEYVYTAIKKPFTHSDFIDASDIIDEVCNRAYDVVDDLCDVYTSCVEEKKHTEELQKIIEEYFNKNIDQPNFYRCENIKKIKFSELFKDDSKGCIIPMIDGKPFGIDLEKAK